MNNIKIIRLQELCRKKIERAIIMNIADRMGNYALLRERLEKTEDKNPLMQLEMIRMNALEEFRELTKPGNIITLNGVTFDDVKRHSMSVEEKEQVVFEIGWACLAGTKSETRDTYHDQDITLRQLESTPHCAMLHILSMIENVSDGNGASQLVSMRYNFYLLDDTKNIFRELIAKINMFYPKIPIGTVALANTDVQGGVQKWTNAGEITIEYQKQLQNAPSEEISDISRLSELLSLHFAVNQLRSESIIDNLAIKDFAYTINESEIYDFKTMSAPGGRYLVAFTDLEELNKGPATSQLYLTPEQYTSIFSKMPIAGIVVNPFNKNGRQIIEKNALYKGEQPNVPATNQNKTNITVQYKPSFEKRKTKGKYLVFKILIVVFSILTLFGIIMTTMDFINSVENAAGGFIVSTVFGGFFALFLWLYRKKEKK